MNPRSLRSDCDGPTTPTHLHPRVQGEGRPRRPHRHRLPGRGVPQAPDQPQPVRPPLEGHPPRTPAGGLPGRRAARLRGRPGGRPGAAGRPAGPGVGRPKKSLDVAGWGRVQRRQVVSHLAGEYPVRWLCRLLDCPRAGLYRTPTAAADEAKLRKAIERVAGAWPTYGYRRVTAMLRRDGWAVHGKRVRRVMRDLGLAAQPPRRRVRTTDSDHPFPRYPNLVAGLTVARPDQVWVADITYVRVHSEFVYLAVLMDVFTR